MPRQIPRASNRTKRSRTDCRSPFFGGGALSLVLPSSTGGGVAVRGEGIRGRIIYAAGMTIPEIIKDIQKIHLQPRYAVRIPPRISPMMKPKEPAAPHIPRAFAFCVGLVKCRAICACAGGMVKAAPIPWNALEMTSPMKVGDRAQTILNKAKKVMPKSKTRRCLGLTLAALAKMQNGS